MDARAPRWFFDDLGADDTLRNLSIAAGVALHGALVINVVAHQCGGSSIIRTARKTSNDCISRSPHPDRGAVARSSPESIHMFLGPQLGLQGEVVPCQITI